LRIQKFDAAVTVVCCALLGFFGWHATEGPRGFAYARNLSEQSGKLQLQLEKVRAQSEQMEARVVLMRPESIDPDMLDELARRTLLMAQPGEIVVINSAKSPIN